MGQFSFPEEIHKLNIVDVQIALNIVVRDLDCAQILWVMREQLLRLHIEHSVLEIDQVLVLVTPLVFKLYSQVIHQQLENLVDLRLLLVFGLINQALDKVFDSNLIFLEYAILVIVQRTAQCKHGVICDEIVHNGFMVDGHDCSVPTIDSEIKLRIP